MIKLRQVFSSNAIFQADAKITIYGSCADINEISCSVIDADNNKQTYSGKISASGDFSIEIDTPSASFNKYKLEIFSESESVILEDVLFGEVWLASGQSNMEMKNSSMPDAFRLYDEVKSKTIRVFDVDYIVRNEKDEFPWDSVYDMTGRWITADQSDKLPGVSAAALKFSSILYDLINKNSDVPVAFLNASWGGTSITSWFPYDELIKDDYIKDRVEKLGLFPTRENWNTVPGDNFKQTGVQYNVKIALLEGLKTRGVIWYQGENETGAEYYNRVYADYLRFYHKVYSKRFGVDPDNFLMLSSLIYPWTYGDSGECNVGYINDAFITTSIESPDKFAIAPIGDLKPSWAFSEWNHPIHPTNKYPLGERMAKIAAANVYGISDIQKTAAYMDSYEIVDDRIKVHFASVGSGLFVDGDKPIGLYVAGEDNIYMPADCKVIGKDTLEVWCEAIGEPKNVAYSMQSLEPCCNIYAGEYPVCPFYTDKVNYINIEAKPWYDTTRTSLWAFNKSGPELDLFYRPIWNPELGSNVCPDCAFTLDKQSLRVSSDSSSVFGCYLKSYTYNTLDLQKYKRLTVDLFNARELTSVLRIESDKGIYDIEFKKLADLYDTWKTYEADLSTIPTDCKIEKVHFLFTQKNASYHFVNMEKVRLWK